MNAGSIDFDKISSLINSYRKRIKKLEFIDEVLWDQDIIKNWQVNEVREIAGTFNRMVLNDKTHRRFHTLIPSGKGFIPAHFHDFVEVATVLQGELYDNLMSKTVTVGGKMVYEFGEPHEPENIKKEDCLLVVDWVRTISIDEALHHLKIKTKHYNMDYFTL